MNETINDPGIATPSSSLTPRRRWIAVIAAAPLVAGLMLGGAGVALGAEGKGPGGSGRGFGARMCKHLECTDEQGKQLRAVMQEMRKDIQPDREAIGKLRENMAAEFAKAKPSNKELRRLQSEIAKHHAEIADRRLDAMLEIHALLDASQRKKLAEVMAKGPRGRKHSRHRGHKK